ncbi:MAG: hypothetical protein KDC44_11370 [Phaeodactylibacter sp.]|nr:hypothetical protein [Phaeodactylibacter sp.]
MKAIIPTVVFLLATILCTAGNTPSIKDGKCRTEVTNFPVSLTVQERVEWDLLRGIWTLSDTQTGNQKVFLFNTYGIIDIIETNAQGKASYENCLWRVESYNGRAFLVLNEQPMSQDLLYRVDITCEGIVLVDVISNEQLVLDHQPKKPEYKVNLTKANMIGSWDCVSYPFTEVQQQKAFGTTQKMPGAFLKLELEANGTYRKSIGNAEQTYVEEGYFEVSKDGQFLIFFAATAGRMEEVLNTTVAQIKYMDTGELVLEISDYPLEKTEEYYPQLRTVTFIH